MCILIVLTNARLAAVLIVSTNARLMSVLIVSTNARRCVHQLASLGWCGLGPGLRLNLAESISGQWGCPLLIGKRDIVDTLFHASRAD